MKKQILSEQFKRMQKLAGINENLNEDEGLLNQLQIYIINVSTLDQGYEHDEKAIKKEQAAIKSSVIKAKGREYFNALEDFASAKLIADEYAGPDDHEAEEEMERTAKILGFSIDDL